MDPEQLQEDTSLTTNLFKTFTNNSQSRYLFWTGEGGSDPVEASRNSRYHKLNIYTDRYLAVPDPSRVLADFKIIIWIFKLSWWCGSYIVNWTMGQRPLNDKVVCKMNKILTCVVRKNSISWYLTVIASKNKLQTIQLIWMLFWTISIVLECFTNFICLILFAPSPPSPWWCNISSI